MFCLATIKPPTKPITRLSCVSLLDNIDVHFMWVMMPKDIHKPTNWHNQASTMHGRLLKYWCRSTC